MAWRQLEWVYNKTFWKITWTHLEQWMWVQQDINKDWFIDNTANLTTDIASSVPMGLVGLNTFWKGANIFTTVAKNIAGNATINWVFNAAFDPWVSKETAYFDTITWPISDAVFYWLWKAAWAWIKTLTKIKYWDIANETNKVINNKELEDSIRKWLASQEWDETLNQIARNSVKKTIDDYNNILDKFIWKAEWLAKRWSNIITSPLIREAKKQVINSFADVLEKQWLTKQAKMLKNLTHSWKGIDKTFKELNTWLKQASKKLTEETNKFVSNPAKLAQLVKADNTLSAMVAKWITEEWIKAEKIVPDTEIEAQAKVTNQIWTTQNVADATKYVADKVEKTFKDFSKKKEWIPFPEFKKAVMSAIQDDLWNINPEAKAMYERILKWFEWIHDDVVKDIHLRKNLYGNKDWKLYFRKVKWAKSIWWAFDTTNTSVYVKYLENQFKDNEEWFFITLFHELTHSIWKWDFKKSLWNKEWTVVEKMYNKFKKAMDSFIVDTLDKQDKEILNRMKDDPDEFLSYIMGELIVWWDSHSLHKITWILRDAWIKDVDINKFKRALNTYLTTRFWWNKIIWKIKYAIDYTDTVEEWAKVLDRELKDLFKTKNIKSVWDVIYWMDKQEIEETMKKLWIKVPKEILDSMSLKELQDTLSYQIHMNLSWLGGFKAAAVWNAIWDIIEFDKKFSKLPNLSYLDWILDKETVDVLKWLPKAIADWNVLNYIKQFKWKISNKVQNILLNLLTTSPEINKDYINIISALWGKLTTPLKEVSKSKKNLFNRFLEEVWSKYDINDMYRWVNELLSWAWYKLIRKWSAKEIEKAIINWEDISKFIENKNIIKVGDNIPTEDMIQYNYSRFNPEVAYNVNKLLDNKNKLNDKLFNTYNITEKDLERVWVNPDNIRTVINQWLPDNYSKLDAYKEWDNIIYTDKSWNIWRVDSKWNKVLIDKNSQIVIKWLVDDRSWRWLSLIKNLEEWYETFIWLKNKIKWCQ